eukprot:scaffold10226_cov124-Isochrysis_galbana.AAC.1
MSVAAAELMSLRPKAAKAEAYAQMLREAGVEVQGSDRRASRCTNRDGPRVPGGGLEVQRGRLDRRLQLAALACRAVPFCRVLVLDRGPVCVRAVRGTTASQSSGEEWRVAPLTDDMYK